MSLIRKHGAVLQAWACLDLVSRVCTTTSSLVACEGANSVQDRRVMHATLNQRGPACLNNIIKFNTEESGRRHLRSSTTNAAVVMRTRTQFGKRTFSVCGPSIWNQIPPHISNLHSVPAFRKALG